MFCERCGQIIPDGSDKCLSCGKPINSGGLNNNQPIQWKPVNKEDYFKELFVSEDEKVVSVIGSSYLRNFLTTGTLTNGYCALTNKRLYFKGKLYRIFGKTAIKRNIEEIIDVEEINASGIEFIKYLWLFYCAMSFLVMMTICIGIGCYSHEFNWIIAGLTILGIDFVFWLLYAFLRKKLFWVEYAGGSLAFSAVSYDINEIHKFQKSIHITKENYNKSKKVN